MKNKIDGTVLAAGGHLKNTVALAFGDKVFVSQHIGDLSTTDSFNAFKNASADLLRMYNRTADLLVHDMHPEYLSTKFAANESIPTTAIQHHIAHAAACKAENQIEGTALAVCWDGTGFGLDGDIWGGEFFILDDEKFAHAAQFKKFRLPGGEIAIREPRRALLGALFEIFGAGAFDVLQISRCFLTTELKTLKPALEKAINSPLTSSAGRLFDAASALLNLVAVNNFEGQAGMALEFCSEVNIRKSYPFKVDFNNIFIVDWTEILTGMLSDSELLSAAEIAGKFHNTLAHVICRIAVNLKIEKVLFSGGCFQNMILTELAADLLEAGGKKVYTHQRIPPNDGGISLGQIAARNLEQVDLKYFV